MRKYNFTYFIYIFSFCMMLASFLGSGQTVRGADALSGTAISALTDSTTSAAQSADSVFSAAAVDSEVSSTTYTLPPLTAAPKLSNFYIDTPSGYILYNAKATLTLFAYSYATSQLYGFYLVLPKSIDFDGSNSDLQAVADQYVQDLQAANYTIDSLKAYSLGDTSDGRHVYYFRPNDGSNNLNADPYSSGANEKARVIMNFPIKTATNSNDATTVYFNANNTAEISQYAVLFAGYGSYNSTDSSYPTIATSVWGNSNILDAKVSTIAVANIRRTLNYTHATVTDTYKIVDQSTGATLGTIKSASGQDGTTYSRVGLVDSFASLKANGITLNPDIYDESTLSIDSGTLTDTAVVRKPSTFTSSVANPSVAGQTYTVSVKEKGQPVTFNYQDDSGKKLSDPVTFDADKTPYVNDSYTVTKDDLKTAALDNAPKGYELVQIASPDSSQNIGDGSTAVTESDLKAITGSYTNTIQKITFVYQKITGSVALNGLNTGTNTSTSLYPNASSWLNSNGDINIDTGTYTLRDMLDASPKILTGSTKNTWQALQALDKYNNGIYDAGDLATYLGLDTDTTQYILYYLYDFKGTSINYTQLAATEDTPFTFDTKGQVITANIPFTPNDSQTTIHYVYGDGSNQGTTAAPDRVVTGLKGQTADADINSPTIANYMPSQSSVTVTANGQTTNEVTVYYFSKASLNLTAPKTIDFGKRKLVPTNDSDLAYLPKSYSQPLQVSQSALTGDIQLPWTLTVSASDSLTNSKGQQITGNPLYYYDQGTPQQLSSSSNILIFSGTGSKTLSDNWSLTSQTGSTLGTDNAQIANNIVNGMGLQFTNNTTQQITANDPYSGTVTWSLNLSLS